MCKICSKVTIKIPEPRMRLKLGDIYLSKVNNGGTRGRCEIYSKTTLKTPEQHRSGVLIVNFEEISHIILVFPLLTLNK